MKNQDKAKDALPRRLRVYQHHHVDSMRWDDFKPRNDDIIITTAYKAGTTWMQTIVGNLIFWDSKLPEPIRELSPWIDLRLIPKEEIDKKLEAQTHRRFVKTHLTLEAIPYFPEVKYIYVGRDGRDVFMSFWNHYKSYKPEFLYIVNNTPGRVGGPLLPCPEDIYELWRNWISKGWFEWEEDGYPFGSIFQHVQTWWDFRHLPNILFVHFNDLLRNLEGEMRRVAEFLEIEVDESAWPSLIEEATFATMKKRAEDVSLMRDEIFTGGAQQFIYKGTNGRWRDVLNEDDVRLYEQVVEKRLSPECARWFEQGASIDKLP
jgi:aryl sulfotransferase